MASPEKELEDQLKDVGNELLNPPSSIEDLLNLLDRLEYNLLKVEQSPSRSTQDALLPSMKALIANELLRHTDTDVKVSVASCINEITRITAPDAPYNDEQMKEVFQLTVAAFGKLSHVSSRCYSKAVSILDTVSKVRACLVMLDLECDALIIEMFRHFLKIIRSNHPHSVFLDMETIMTLVLNESEDISLELLCTLLDSVRKEKQNISPVSFNLGEKVITNCAKILKPYIMEAVRSVGIALNDYAKIVASICQNASDMLKENHVNNSGEHLTDENKLAERTDLDVQTQADGNKLAERTDLDLQTQVAGSLAADAVCPGEVGSIVGGSMSILSNDTAQTGNDEAFIDEKLSKHLERCHRTKQSKSTVVRGNYKPDDLDSMKAVKSETEPETVPKKRGRRPNSLMNPEEGYDNFWIGRGRMAPKVPCRRKYHRKEMSSSHSENPVSKEEALPSAHEKEIEAQVISPKIAHNVTIAASSSSPNCSLPDGNHPKRGQRKKKGSTLNQDAGQNSLYVLDAEDKAPKPEDISLKKEAEDTRDLEIKPQRYSRKKGVSAKTNGETTPAPEDVVSNKEGPGDFEEKSLHMSVTDVGARGTNEEVSLVLQTVGEKRKSGGKTTAEKDVAEVSGDKKMVSGPRSQSSKQNENRLDKNSKTKSKRKPTPGKEGASELPHTAQDLGEQLVGRKIKVWWPKDKTFYEGVVDSFDHIKKKHKVSYADGDEEILYLRKERWELVWDDGFLDEGKQADLPCPDASSDLRRKKKRKLKRGALAGKPSDGCKPDNPIMIENTSKDEMDNKVKDGQISAGKSKIESVKTGEESNWNTPETGGTEKLYELAKSLASLSECGKSVTEG